MAGTDHLFSCCTAVHMTYDCTAAEIICFLTVYGLWSVLLYSGDTAAFTYHHISTQRPSAGSGIRQLGLDRGGSDPTSRAPGEESHQPVNVAVGLGLGTVWVLFVSEAGYDP